MYSVPKGPDSTKNTMAAQNIVKYHTVAFSLRPPDLLWPGRFLERQHASVKSRKLASARRWSR